MKYVGTSMEQMDGVFLPILPSDRVHLEFHLRRELQERIDQYDPEYEDTTKEEYIKDWTQYYMERLEATHFFLYVSIPEDEKYTELKWEDYTWWDMGSILCKQVDGEWYAWSEDPGDTGNIWYQSTYTKAQAYAVRDFHIQWAERGELLSGEYDGRDVYIACKAELMTFW